MEKTWSNKYISIKAEINNLGVVSKNSPIEVLYTLNDSKEVKKFNIHNEDYPIVSFDKQSGNIKVDENILANKILTDLYENNEIAPAFLAGESGKYLVDKAKDKNFYYEDDYIYDLYGLKAFRQSKLSKYIDTIDDEYLKTANETLNRVIDEMPVYDCDILAKNDLHFEIAEKEDKDFGKIKPVYKCNKRKVNGLIKHVKNSLAKHNSLDISGALDFVEILKRKTKDIFSWEDKKKEHFYKLIKNDGTEEFDLLIDETNVTIFSKKDSKKFNFNQMEEIIDFLV